MKNGIKLGLWFAGVYLIWALISIILPKITSSDFALWIGVPIVILTIPAIFISFIFFGRYDAMYHSSTPQTITVLIISVLLYFLLGALIGWIVGKVKARKE